MVDLVTCVAMVFRNGMSNPVRLELRWQNKYIKGKRLDKFCKNAPAQFFERIAEAKDGTYEQKMLYL